MFAIGWARPRLTSLSLLLLASSCTFADYEPLDLDPLAVLNAIEQRRASAPDAVSLDNATSWMRANGPAVRESVAAWRTARARASVETPLPNPSIQAGANIGFGGSGLSDDPDVAPFGGIGVTIPLSDRRAVRDALEHAHANRAHVEVVATWREQWIELRGKFAELSIIQARAALRDELVGTGARSVEAAHNLVEAGVADAADVGSFQLEHARNSAMALDDLAALDRLIAAIAHTTGVGATESRRAFEAGRASRPEPPETIPSLAKLKGLALARHPVLLRMRADHATADHAFRLAIEEQYPDLRIGPEFGAEIGESYRVLGLSLGIDLPLFDRNQREVATTRAARDQTHARFATATDRVIAELERAARAVKLAQRRVQLFDSTVTPLAINHLELARRTAAAGTTGILRYLDAVRSTFRAQLEALDAQLELVRAWSALELATGTPMLHFSIDNGDHPDIEPPPPTLDDTHSSTAGRNS